MSLRLWRKKTESRDGRITREKNKQHYYQEHGDLLVPTMYVTEDGIRLGRGVKRQLQDRKKGALSLEQIQRLDAIGMCWDDYWTQKYKIAQDYLVSHSVESISTTTVGDFHLGKWLKKQYKDLEKNVLPKERAQLLRELPGFLEYFSGDRARDEWLQMYEWLRVYVQEMGTFPVEGGGHDADSLNKWVRAQRRRFQIGRMATWEQQKLESIDYPFAPGKMEDLYDRTIFARRCTGSVKRTTCLRSDFMTCGILRLRF